MVIIVLYKVFLVLFVTNFFRYYGDTDFSGVMLEAWTLQFTRRALRTQQNQRQSSYRPKVVQVGKRGGATNLLCPK
jgi:hypothetical protein